MGGKESAARDGEGQWCLERRHAFGANLWWEGEERRVASPLEDRIMDRARRIAREC